MLRASNAAFSPGPNEPADSLGRQRAEASANVSPHAKVAGDKTGTDAIEGNTVSDLSQVLQARCRRRRYPDVVGVDGGGRAILADGRHLGEHVCWSPTSARTYVCAGSLCW